jgi:quercetin dioxygenase-like cupin family protein
MIHLIDWHSWARNHNVSIVKGGITMKHIHYLDQEPEKTETDGAKGAVIRHLITEKDGAPNFNMRVVSIEPGGQSPNHSHPWEHEFFILSGRGIGEVNDKEENLKQGDILYVPPDVQHCLRAIDAMEVI